MRKVSRRFPNGVTVYVDNFLSGLTIYTAMRGTKELGIYRVKKHRHRPSDGWLGCRHFGDFYGWLRAARFFDANMGAIRT